MCTYRLFASPLESVDSCLVAESRGVLWLWCRPCQRTSSVQHHVPVIVRENHVWGSAMRLPAAMLLGPLLAGASAAAVRGLPRGISRFVRPRAASALNAATHAQQAVPSLDAKLISDSPDVVADSLRRRRAPAEQLQALQTIGELQRRYAQLSFDVSTQLGVRKQLSPQIGALLKGGQTDEAEKLKEQVAAASAEAKRLEDELAAVESERAALLDALPNLLDPRVPEGADDNDNELIEQWEPAAGIRPATDRWHDDIALKLNGLDLDGAAKISGARFSVRARSQLAAASGLALTGPAASQARLTVPAADAPADARLLAAPPPRPAPSPGAARSRGAPRARARQLLHRPAHDRARIH